MITLPQISQLFVYEVLRTDVTKLHVLHNNISQDFVDSVAHNVHIFIQTQHDLYRKYCNSVCGHLHIYLILPSS